MCFVIVFVVTLTIQYVLLLYSINSYIRRAVVTSLLLILIIAYEPNWNRDQCEIDLPLSIPFQQAAAAYTWKMGRDFLPIRRWIKKQTKKNSCTCSRMSVRYCDMSYDTCRGTNVWPLIGSKFAKNSWKLDNVDKTRCTWPFQAKNRYDVTLANHRAPGVWFVVGFIMYLFLAQKWPGMPFVGKNAKNKLSSTAVKARYLEKCQ